MPSDALHRVFGPILDTGVRIAEIAALLELLQQGARGSGTTHANVASSRMTAVFRVDIFAAMVTEEYRLEMEASFAPAVIICYVDSVDRLVRSSIVLSSPREASTKCDLGKDSKEGEGSHVYNSQNGSADEDITIWR